MIRPLIVAVLAVLFAASAARADCGLDHPSDCRTTNALVWNKDFQRALKAFLRRAPGGQWRPGYPISAFTQARALLGGPPRKARLLVDGSWLFAACRQHECDDKAAVVVSPAGRIAMVALLMPEIYAGNSTKPNDFVLRVFAHDRVALARFAPMFLVEARRALSAVPGERLTRAQAFLAAPAHPFRRPVAFPAGPALLQAEPVF